MRHFPIFLDLADRRVLIAGTGAVAEAKLRLLLKTTARLELYAPEPEAALRELAEAQGVALHRRPLTAADLPGAALVYAAHGAAAPDAETAALARAAGVLVNVVDDLEASDFITPALVDRDPVTVAIGTEGTAPVLARAIKAEMEERLPQHLGTLAGAARGFRGAAEALPPGRARRDFWTDFHFRTGPLVLEREGEGGLDAALAALLARHLAAAPTPGRVDLVSAGPGDPDLLTLRARRLLDRADVVIHDRLVAPAILELARREATFVAVGKEGFGPSTAQSDINALMIDHARQGAHVVRLKGGDASIFGRLDEEIAALDGAGIDWAVTPGVTAASAAAAAIGASLTQRARNSDLRLMTAHDLKGYAEQDWRALARPGAVAAIYMGKRAARFVQGRMLMHGADPGTPVTLVENASLPAQRILASRLDRLPADLAQAAPTGPVLMLMGLAPRRAPVARPALIEEMA
ncbi:siroheme synthase CysG [Pararhodobacter sp. SW119]|uniref:siroheme synthase CysG n=1 Tax=Pararhodobacter sp. SW119 TaxID=2780075 RepID=UPI001ADF80EF|nr:siroheme synthase CysG [Pararhodobacter sp. SW119]